MDPQESMLSYSAYHACPGHVLFIGNRDDNDDDADDEIDDDGGVDWWWCSRWMMHITRTQSISSH